MREYAEAEAPVRQELAEAKKDAGAWMDLTPSVEDIKKAVNGLLWMYGPKDLTLAEAETRALKILDFVIVEPGTHEKAAY